MAKATSRIMKLARWLVPLAIIAGAAALKGLSDGREVEAASLPPLPVCVIVPERGDLARTLRLNAHIESESMVTVLPLVSGILQELFVEQGQQVQKDQIIARVDAARYELQLKQAEAAYFSSKSSYERVDQLYKAGATTQQNFDQAKAQYEAYASQYDLARLQLSYANVKSPVQGVVLVKHLSVGSIAAPERPLVTIGDLAELVVRARIPERYYRLFEENRELMAISVFGPDGDEYQARIKSISPFVSAETKNFEALVSVLGDVKGLRPGMFVSVSFKLAEWKDVLSLPYAALSGGDTLWYVENDQAYPLRFAPKDGSDTHFIVPEDYARTRFISEGFYFVREGSPVQVLGARAP
jgi:membrane fusion protein, multidrug efflux system